MPNKISVATFYQNYLVSGSKSGLMANEWQVYIPGVTGDVTQAKLDFFVNTVTLPNLELIEVTKEYRGRSFAAPAGFKYTGDVKFDVTLDTDLTIYSYFAGLISAISPLAQVSGGGNIGDGDGTSPVTTSDAAANASGFIWPAEWTPDATVSSIQIKLGPDKVEQTSGTAPTVGGVYTLHGAFPTEISGIEFTNGTPEIAGYSVTLAYAYFEYQAGQVSA